MNEPTPAPREPSVEEAARLCPRCGDYSCGCFDEYPARAEPQRTPELWPEEAFPVRELPEDVLYELRIRNQKESNA